MRLWCGWKLMRYGMSDIRLLGLLMVMMGWFVGVVVMVFILVMGLFCL